MSLSSKAGALIDAYSYTAFGGPRTWSGASTRPYRCLGNAWNPQARLHDFHVRAYDPALGRFLSEDPMAGHAAFPQTLNPYAYEINSPLAQPAPKTRQCR